jgi:glycosyltransferase involved in cell wall biosynthesis
MDRMSADSRRQTESAPAGDSPALSVIVPVFNEAENLEPLCREVHEALEPRGLAFEVIFADDGSTDATPAILKRLAADFPRVRVVTLRRNSGQTAALSAAIDAARGAVLVPMDGDGQNDPADIPRLLDRLNEGYDVVSGWRRDRKDPFISRRLPSAFANRIIARIGGLRLHDFGCTLKAYRRDVLAGVRLYGEMHRFVPIYAKWHGARVTELEVNHRPRTRGRSKYGIGRTFRVVLDLVVIRFLDRYSQRPMHLFGGFGLWSLLVAFLSFSAATFYKIVALVARSRFGLDRSAWPSFYDDFGKDFVETPLPVFVALFGVSGILSILMGLLAEMVMRTYFESLQKPTYVVKEQGRET